MECKTLYSMGKGVLIFVLAVLTTALLIGIGVEIQKFSQDSALSLAKHDIVGGYDKLYDEYFPRYYHSSGLLSLPFDDIVEPFEAWFAGERNMSRIDYYYGT